MDLNEYENPNHNNKNHCVLAVSRRSFQGFMSIASCCDWFQWGQESCRALGSPPSFGYNRVATDRWWA